MDVSLATILPTGAASPARSSELHGERQPASVEKKTLEARQAEAGAERQSLDRQPLEKAVSEIESFVQSIRRDLNFALDDSSGRVVVKVTDRASGNVVRQIPSEEALHLAESLEQVRSLLFKAEA